MCIQGVQKVYRNVKYTSCLHDFLNSNLPTNIVVHSYITSIYYTYFNTIIML